MRILIKGESIPMGFQTFKCASPGCRKKACIQVHDKCLAHLCEDTRCYCLAHGFDVVKRDSEDGQLCAYYERIVEQASPGCCLYRKRQNAFGGWYGWEYAVMLTPADCRERQCPNPYALVDNDGNYIVS